MYDSNGLSTGSVSVMTDQDLCQTLNQRGTFRLTTTNTNVSKVSSGNNDARTFGIDVMAIEAKRYDSMYREYARSRALGFSPDQASCFALDLGSFIGEISCPTS